MAEYLSLGPIDANTAMWVRDATSREKMPTIEKLSDPDFFPYRYGHAFWSYVAGRWGDSAVGDMLRATGPGGRIEDAIETVLGTDEETLTATGTRRRAKTYAALFETTSEARNVRAAADEREDQRRDAESRAVHQPRRQAAGVPLGAFALLGRHVSRRRRTGQGHSPAHQDGGRPALRQPRVPGILGRLGAGQQTIRVRRAQQGPAGADDHRRRQRQAPGRTRVPGHR